MSTGLYPRSLGLDRIGIIDRHAARVAATAYVGEVGARRPAVLATNVAAIPHDPHLTLAMTVRVFAVHHVCSEVARVIPWVST